MSCRVPRYHQLIVDIMVSIFFFYCLIRGILRGTVREAFSITGVFSGLMVASAYYSEISQFCLSWINSIQIRHLSGYLISFGIVYLIINLIGIVVLYLFHISNSGWGSRITGGVVGSFKGLLFVSVLLIPLVTFSPKDSNYIKNSALFPFETTISEQLTRVISKDMRRNYSLKIKNYKKTGANLTNQTHHRLR